MMKSGSNLERVLEAGHFAVTAEIGPPMDCNGEVVLEKARLLKGCADAFNITDCQTAVVRMSCIASASSEREYCGCMLNQLGPSCTTSTDGRSRSKTSKPNVISTTGFRSPTCMARRFPSERMLESG